MTKESQVWTAILVIALIMLVLRMTIFVPEMGTAYIVETEGEVAKAQTVDRVTGTAELSISRTIGIWFAAFFTIGILSFLYKDNPLYKVSEAVFVGVSAAYWMVVAFWTTIIPNLLGKISPDWVQSWAMPGLSTVREDNWYLYIIPLVLGVMLLMRLAPKGAWIARWPLAFVIGTTAGLRLVGFLEADFLSQIQNTIASFADLREELANATTSSDYSAIGWKYFGQVVLVISVLACLVYFFFSIEHKGAVGGVARFGIWILMITFGAAFGYTVMGRIALLAIRLEFLFTDWLHIIEPGGG